MLTAFQRKMREWTEDLTWGLNLLKVVKSRGQIASILRNALLEKGLTDCDACNWDEPERNLLKTLAQTVIFQKWIIEIFSWYSIFKEAAAIDNAKEMVVLQLENTTAVTEALASLLLWYQSLQDLLGEGIPFCQFAHSYKFTLEELEVSPSTEKLIKFLSRKSWRLPLWRTRLRSIVYGLPGSSVKLKEVPSGHVKADY